MAEKAQVCKTCGKSGHSRRSSINCDFHIPPQKRRINQIDFETETYTIKCGLNKFCKRNQLLISSITEDVLEVSSLMIEVSILVNFHYCKLLESGSNLEDEKPDILKFFYQLQGKQQLDEEYSDLRRRIRGNEQF